MSYKQKVFPRRQSVGVMTVMPQHAEKEAGTLPLPIRCCRRGRGSSGLVQLTTRREGNVSSIKTAAGGYSASSLSDLAKASP